MKNLIKIFIGLVLLQIYSCINPINCRKHFTVYKEPIFESEINYPIRTDGVFISTNQKGAFALYKSGMAKFIGSNVPIDGNFWSYPEVNFYQIEEQIDFIEKEGAGHFQISNDTITIQTFSLANDQLCRRSVYETKGIILNDTTIRVFTDYSFWFDYELIKEQSNIYKLYKTEHKPDSTLAWFNKKWWYKRNLHESRK